MKISGFQVSKFKFVGHDSYEDEFIGFTGRITGSISRDDHVILYRELELYRFVFVTDHCHKLPVFYRCSTGLETLFEMRVKY